MRNRQPLPSRWNSLWRVRSPTISADAIVTLIAAARRPKSTAPVDPQASETHPPELPSSAGSASETPAAGTIQVQSAPSEAQVSAPEAATQIIAENILRVEAGRIDNVLNLVGELIIGK